MKKTLLLILFVYSILYSFGEQKKEYVATRIFSSPKIDGSGDDSCWQHIPVATDFIQAAPHPGNPSCFRTEVKIAYDNFAIYVLAVMYDPNPDSILHELSKRDNVFAGPNADAFRIVIDTYHDGQNAFFFGVSAAGVQADTRVSGQSDYDDSWDVAWESKAKITSQGWNVEIKIPYSAFRFPKKEIQEWGLNFSRQIKRYREQSNWTFVNPEVNGFINQAGILKGITNITPPVRLSVSPYISAYADNYRDSNGVTNSYILNGGADVKYGINESFTLDATLIPDFGQVRSDDKVLNLSPFEIRYDERRSFFTEGTELFNKAGLFYSRRVGGTPIGNSDVYNSLGENEIVTDNPSSAQLYNATKISGRTKDNLGVGFFNATTAPAYATVYDSVSETKRTVLTQPLTNYNVFVLDQLFKNNSFISLVNTNVMRNGQAYDANVTGTEFKFANKKNSYAVWGQGAVSQLYFDKQQLGETYRIGVGKISGNYTNNLTYRIRSNKFDPNDLGYLDRNNETVISMDNNYKVYKPFWKINSMSNDLTINYYMLYKPRTYTRFNIDWNTDIDFRNYLSFDFFTSLQPFTSYDYYEPRTVGRYYVYPKNYFGLLYCSTDYRKKFAVDVYINYRIFMERQRQTFLYSVKPRYRFSDKFKMIYSFSSENKMDDVGFVDDIGFDVIFGVRNVNTITNSLESNYIFSNTMSLSLYARHYLSQVNYKEFYSLNDAGKESSTSYNQNNDINFNAFNVDMAFTWQFLPASELSLVWKNSILTQENELVKKYFNNLNRTLDSPQLNSLSVKVLWYVDYLSLKKRK